VTDNENDDTYTSIFNRRRVDDAPLPAQKYPHSHLRWHRVIESFFIRHCRTICVAPVNIHIGVSSTCVSVAAFQGPTVQLQQGWPFLVAT